MSLQQYWSFVSGRPPRRHAKMKKKKFVIKKLIFLKDLSTNLSDSGI